MNVSAKDLIKRFGRNKASILKVAEYIGFKHKEIDMLSRFWNPAFNGGLILMSDELVIGKLTKWKSKGAMSNFHKKIREEYKENLDYEKINKSHSLVQNWIKTFGKNPSKLGAKQYYAVTGNTYKDLLVRATTKEGKECREYYRKVENLACLMREYTQEIGKIMFEDEKKELEEIINRQAEELSKKNNRDCLLNSFTDNLQKRRYTGYFYIASTEKYSKENYFKLGITTDLTKRLRSYNCERPEYDMMYYCFIHKCHNPREIEKRTKYLLCNFQKKNMKKIGSDETYFCNFIKLKTIVSLVCDNYSNEISSINNIINDFDNDFSKTPIIPKEIKYKNYEILKEINPLKKIKESYTNILDLSEGQKKEKLIKAINNSINQTPSNKYKNLDFNNIIQTVDLHTEKIVLYWPLIIENLMIICNIKSKKNIKSSLWKPILKNMAKNTNSIKIRWYKENNMQLIKL